MKSDIEDKSSHFTRSPTLISLLISTVTCSIFVGGGNEKCYLHADCLNVSTNALHNVQVSRDFSVYYVAFNKGHGIVGARQGHNPACFK